MIQNTIEAAYFHTGNSGVTVSIDRSEKINRAGDHVDEDYRLKVVHSAHGASTEVSFPLGSDHMVDYLIEALTRVREKMIKGEFKGNLAFMYGREPCVDAYVTVINGLRREPVFESHEQDGSTVTRIVAFKFYDGDRYVRTELVENPDIYSTWGSSK
jgi:hypothetical protein